MSEIGANKSVITVLFCKDEWRALCVVFLFFFNMISEK